MTDDGLDDDLARAVEAQRVCRRILVQARESLARWRRLLEPNPEPAALARWTAAVAHIDAATAKVYRDDRRIAELDARRRPKRGRPRPS